MSAGRPDKPRTRPRAASAPAADPPAPVHVVWLKRDLRVTDHRPLAEAAARGPVVCLFVHEPEVMTAEDFDPSHLRFINESLADLDARLRTRGGRMTYRLGRMPDVLEELRQAVPLAGLWSHEETGNAVTYRRDLRVGAWAREHGIPWTEFPGGGVQRRSRGRDGWAARWEARMAERPAEAPARIVPAERVPAGRPASAADLGLPETDKDEAQPGGETCAEDTLDSFLRHRGLAYRRGMSSPVTAFDVSSRLSPHLAWGTLSVRRAVRAARRRVEELRDLRDGGGGVDGRWFGSLASFLDRLRWRDHFIQKLEDEPRIEFENFHRGYDGLREGEFDADRFAALCGGRTGFPMVDAVVRALLAGGWVNFRMRAMLASFAAYHLWLHWRPTSVFFARHFLDYEPGIHYSQFQMQGGTTGINAVRVYSPAKQVIDHDPRGVFIRRYVPELGEVPDEWLAEPHRMPAAVQDRAGCVIGRDYPPPVVDAAEAARRAKERIFALRAREDIRREAAAVWLRHGSRKPPRPGLREDRGFDVPGASSATPDPPPRSRRTRRRAPQNGDTGGQMMLFDLGTE
jgi:deoxyribodipyrimidine photo-lyase